MAEETTDTTAPQEGVNDTDTREGSAPAWVDELRSTITDLKSVIEKQAATIEEQRAALDDAAAKMAEQKQSFIQQTASLVHHGQARNDQSEATASAAFTQPPNTGYTPMRDLDFLPEKFREGKTQYRPLGG